MYLCLQKPETQRPKPWFLQSISKASFQEELHELWAKTVGAAAKQAGRGSSSLAEDAPCVEISGSKTRAAGEVFVPQLQREGAWEATTLL